MTFLSAVIFLLKLFYTHSFSVRVMSNRDYLLLCVAAILGAVIITVCTKLENINFYNNISTKKSL